MIIIILFSVLYGDYNPRTMIIIMPFFIYLLWISEFHFECVKDKLDPLLHIFQSELLVLSSSKDPHHWWRQDFPTAWPSHGSGLAIIRKLLIVFSGRLPTTSVGIFRQHQFQFVFFGPTCHLYQFVSFTQLMTLPPASSNPGSCLSRHSRQPSSLMPHN